MDFFKNCQTGIYALSDFSHVRYWCFSAGSENAEDGCKLEIFHRSRNTLVHWHGKSRILWIFEAPEGAQRLANTAVQFSDSAEVGQIVEVSSGVFKASDLALPMRFRQSIPGASTPSILDLYANLIAAIKAHVAFRLARESPYIPLSTQCFALTQNGDFQLQDISVISLARLSFRLTSTGTLLISIFSGRNDLVSLEDLRHVGLLSTATKIILAPVSTNATFVNDNIPDFDSDANFEWRRMLLELLLARGINAAHLDHPKYWINVRLSKNKQYWKTNPKIGNCVIIWPTFLCFALKASIVSSELELEPISSNTETALSLVSGLDGETIGSAEKWILEQANRDRQIATRRQQFHESVAQYPSISSPMSSRNLTYGESHGLPGVYPTPPDGLAQTQFNGGLDHAMSLPADTPSMYGTQDIDMKDFAAADGEQPLNSLQPIPDTKSPDISGFDDDLFEDGEEFAGQKVTDADFDFFDAPGENEAEELQDISPGLDSGSVSSPPLDISTMETGINMNPSKQALTNDALPGAVEKSPDNKIFPTPQSSGAQIIDANLLSPQEIQRRLFAIPGIHSSESEPNKSIFGPLVFNADMREADAKYSKAGLFGFSRALTNQKRMPGWNISLPPRKKRNFKYSGSANGQNMVIRDSDSSSTTDDSASEVDVDEELSQGVILSERSSPVETGAKAVLSLDSLATVLNSLFQSDHIQRVDFDNFVQNDEWIPRFDADFISTAQLLTEQIVFADEDLMKLVSSNMSSQKSSFLDNRSITTQALYKFQTKTRNVLGLSEAYTLLKFATIADSSTDQQAVSKTMPKPNQHKNQPPTRLEAGTSGNLFRIPTPFVRIRRNDTLWDVLPPAINFWNTLGLAPTSGPKNVVFYTIYPTISGMKDAVSTFVTELGLCYESCKLGNHTRGDEVSGSTDASIPWDLNGEEADSPGFVLNSLCENLGTDLSRFNFAHATDENLKLSNIDSFVVYVVDPLESSSSLSSIASAFWRLLKRCKHNKSIFARSDSATVVLQVVPKSLIWSNGGVVLLPTYKLQLIAREVYNKCSKRRFSEDSLDLAICTNSSIRLAESLPRKIPFELVIDPPSNVLLDNSQLHVAYAHSSSGNWVTAAFSDNTGRNQSVITYCVSGSRTFLEIATEIWQTCIHIMQIRKVNWRLCIARAGVMGIDELDTWANLASPQQPFPLIVVITSVETEPAISLTTSLSAASPSNNAAKTNQTPAATPSHLGFSPDPIVQTPTGTPSESTVMDATNDPDAYLIDTTDETWSIILSHRLMLSSGPDDHQLSLSSALVMKVPPSTPTSNPFNTAEVVESTRANCVAVHLHWARSYGKGQDPGVPSASNLANALPKTSADSILREYLVLYRALALLAKVRGLGDWMAGVTPWHILAALRVAEGLDRVYGDERWTSH